MKRIFGNRCSSENRPNQIFAGFAPVDNLEPVCWDCHRVIHEVEHSL